MVSSSEIEGFLTNKGIAIFAMSIVCDTRQTNYDNIHLDQADILAKEIKKYIVKKLQQILHSQKQIAMTWQSCWRFPDSAKHFHSQALFLLASLSVLLLLLLLLRFLFLSVSTPVSTNMAKGVRWTMIRKFYKKMRKMKMSYMSYFM